jgi:hypothetical protein
VVQKFSLLNTIEPTDEQLHLITLDALNDVLIKNEQGDLYLKKLLDDADQNNLNKNKVEVSLNNEKY